MKLGIKFGSKLRWCRLALNVVFCVICLSISGCGGEVPPSNDEIRSLLHDTHNDTEEYTYGPTPELIAINGKSITCSDGSKASGRPIHIIKVDGRPVDVWVVFCRSPKNKDIRYYLWCKKVNGQWVVLSAEDNEDLFGHKSVKAMLTREK